MYGCMAIMPEWTLLYINNIQRMLNEDLTRFMQSLPRIHGNRQTEGSFCW